MPASQKKTKTKNKKWTLYILETTDGRLYTGITTDLERRFNEHLHSKKKGAKYFRSQKPKKVRLTEKFKNRSLASKREAEIKKLSRNQKLDLIKKGR